MALPFGQKGFVDGGSNFCKLGEMLRETKHVVCVCMTDQAGLKTMGALPRRKIFKGAENYY